MHTLVKSLIPYFHIVHGGAEIVKRNTSYEELRQVENKRADAGEKKKHNYRGEKKNQTKT